MTGMLFTCITAFELQDSSSYSGRWEAENTHDHQHLLRDAPQISNMSQTL